MIGMKIDAVKGLFFDKPAVIGAMERATVRVFNRFGAYVRLTARRSIRKIGKKGKASLPGQPPKSRTGLLREHIYYVYDKNTRSVVIGAALLNRSTWAQKTLEGGGTIRQKNPRRRFRKIGDGGEIRIIAAAHAGGRNALGQFQEASAAEVGYTLLSTQAQADRANRLNEELYGPAEIVAAILPRPYMAPAFETAKEKLPSLWENAISKT
jgi:hypothetical protein